MNRPVRVMLCASIAGATACGPGDQVARDLAGMREELQAQRRATEELRSRLERLESGGPEPGSTNDDVRRWPAQRLDVLATLRETIEQLQED